MRGVAVTLSELYITIKEARKDIIKFCEDNGIRFYAVNKSFEEEEYANDISRKINADLFIDDRNIGGFPGWGEVYQKLTNTIPPIPQKKKGFLGLFK